MQGGWGCGSSSGGARYAFSFDLGVCNMQKSNSPLESNRLSFQQ